MLTCIHLKYMKYQLKVNKIYGFTPYSFDDNTQTIVVSTERRRILPYRVSVLVHALYCLSMLARLYTKSFDFFYSALGTAWFIAFIAFFIIRLNWNVDDKLIDCVNCMIRFEKPLVRDCPNGLSNRVLKGKV
jgi:hypothetical protein